MRQQTTDNELNNIQTQRTAAMQAQNQVGMTHWPLLDSTKRPGGPHLVDVVAVDNMEDHIMISWHEEYKTHYEVHKDEHGILEMWSSVDIADKDLALAWMSTYIGKALKHYPFPTTSYEFVHFDYGIGTTNTPNYSSGGTITTSTPPYIPNTSTGTSDNS